MDSIIRMQKALLWKLRGFRMVIFFSSEQEMGVKFQVEEEKRSQKVTLGAYAIFLVYTKISFRFNS